MAKIPSSLINISALLQGLGELGAIKKHLFKASREILLAVQSLLQMADGYVSGPGTDKYQAMASVLAYAQKTLRTVVARLPHDDDEQFAELQGKVFETILSVIDYEIKETGQQKNPKSKMKQEVLNAIRDVLTKEMKKTGQNHDTIS